MEGAVKTILEEWGEPAGSLVAGRPYSVVGKLRTIAIRGDTLEDSRKALQPIIVDRFRRLGSRAGDILPQPNDCELLKRKVLCPPVTQADLDRFGLAINEEDLLIRTSNFVVGTVQTVPNTPSK